MGRLSLFSASYLLLLVALEGHLVCCKSWKHTLRVPGTKTVAAIWHYYVLNVFTATELDTEKMIDVFELRKGRFKFQAIFIYFESREKKIIEFFDCQSES